jgi:ribosomal protein L29
MARGWESKSVEAQMEESLAEPAKKRTVLTPEELQKQRTKTGLELSRSRVAQQLEQSTNERYSELLRRTLADPDQQISQL